MPLKIAYTFTSFLEQSHSLSFNQRQVTIKNRIEHQYKHAVN